MTKQILSKRNKIAVPRNRKPKFVKLSMFNFHLKHSKRCLHTTVLMDNDSLSINVCLTTFRIVSAKVFKQQLTAQQFLRWRNGLCIECAKPIDKSFISTLTCAPCESKKIHVKFW